MPKALKTNAKGSNSKPRKKKNSGPNFFCALVRSDLKLEIVTEHRFHPTRRWRFDYAILEHKIAIEQDGGIWMKGGGAHSRPQNILRDMEKTTQANVLGWTVIRRTPQQLNTQETLDLIKQTVEMKSGKIFHPAIAHVNCSKEITPETISAINHMAESVLTKKI